MSELFGLCCDKTVNISFSFTKLSERNSLEESGWGVGFYRTGNVDQPPFATIIKEPVSARESIFNYFLKYGYISSNLFISHFRLASIGTQVPLNTHPFQLMLDPRPDADQEKSWIFAHSGTMREIKNDPRFQSVLKPHGNTDSEHIFCYLVEQLRQQYVENGFSLSLEEKIRIIEESATALSRAHPDSLNCILCDGYRMYAFYGGHTAARGSGMWYLIRRPPHQKLAVLDQSDGMTVQLLDKISDESAAIIATNPLSPVTDGKWIPFQLNELKVFENGDVIYPVQGSDSR